MGPGKRVVKIHKINQKITISTFYRLQVATSTRLCSSNIHVNT